MICKKLLKLIAITTTVFCLLISHIDAQDLSDDEIVAIYIYKLIKYVKWNDIVSPKVTVCTVGYSKVGDNLESLKKENMKVIKNFDFERLDSKKCNILYIDNSDESNYKSILRKTYGLPILTVSNIRGFASGGGMIEFEKIGYRIKPVVNPSNAKRVNIKILGEFLNASKIVGR